MTYDPIHFVINPASGQPEPVLHAINTALHGTGIDWQVHVTTEQHDGTAAVRAALDAGAALVVAYGGDGTVKSVINGLMDTSVPLALLHGGTGNALAYSLEIPADLEQAVRLIVGEHQLRALDVGRVTCEDRAGHFVLRSSIGLQNQLLQAATPELKQQFGNLAYLVAGLRSLAQRETIKFRLDIDGETVEVEGVTCIIANSASVGGEVHFDFAPGVAMDDGLLDVFVLDASLLPVISSSLGADQYPNHWRGQSIRVEMDSPSTVTLDGEPFGETPITATVMPQAVRVVVP